MTFEDLNRIIYSRDVQFIRMHKDELTAWSYFSVWFVFHPNELREFIDYIDWNLFFQTPDMVRQYRKDQLSEFWELVDDEVKDILEVDYHVRKRR